MHKLFKRFSSFSRNMKSIRNQLMGRSDADTELKASDFVVTFKHEGDMKLRVPEFHPIDFLSRRKRAFIYNTYAFTKRSPSEALLRRTVFQFYQDGILDPGKSIIDIGAWIGDNSVVWSKLINPDLAIVYAIDPSASNIEFGKKIAELNNCANISWHVAACAEIEGQKLYYKGSIGHTRFNQEGSGKENPAQTTTLDNLVGKENLTKIGLIHVDVEGMERSVIAGAKNIIAKSKPVILYEQHIGEEDPLEVFALLRSHGYRLFMINEVLSDSAVNCRNFFAFPPGMALPDLPEVDLIKGRDQGVFYATHGKSLLAYPTD